MLGWVQGMCESRQVGSLIHYRLYFRHGGRERERTMRPIADKRQVGRAHWFDQLKEGFVDNASTWSLLIIGCKVNKIEG